MAVRAIVVLAFFSHLRLARHGAAPSDPLEFGNTLTFGTVGAGGQQSPQRITFLIARPKQCLQRSIYECPGDR